jgi:hypothetical protein
MAANPSPLPGMVHIVEGAALPANPTFNDCFPPESGRRGRWRRMSACDPKPSFRQPRLPGDALSFLWYEFADR